MAAEEGNVSQTAATRITFNAHLDSLDKESTLPRKIFSQKRPVKSNIKLSFVAAGWV